MAGGKETSSRSQKRKQQRHDPLSTQLRRDEVLPEDGSGAKSRGKGKRRIQSREREEKEFIPHRLSRKIMEQARQQQEEDDDETTPQSEAAGMGAGAFSITGVQDKGRFAFGDDDDDDEEFSEDEDDYLEEIEMTEEDEATFRLFMNENSGGASAQPKKTLGDIIFEKIREHEDQALREQGQGSKNDIIRDELEKKLDEKVVKVYTEVGKVLKHYTSGRVPKAFKIVPALRNWEEIVFLTRPEEWSSPAFFQATRLFVSNLNPRMCQRFLAVVLLPKILEDLEENNRLNFHLYQALRKSLFKPASFFKGVLIPLCENCSTSLRHALILASVLKKVSIPVLHVSATLMKLAQLDYNGSTSIFIRVLLDKKYALPFRVVDAIVTHFVNFTNTHRRGLPVLWHQCLLTFVQRYKTDLTAAQKESLRVLLHSQNHYQITEEIRRELFKSKCRNDGPRGEVGSSVRMRDEEMDDFFD
eukprot:TRINITY_DN4170_c0_g1_i2.p1 TRINITY_DN4170_c0_g1~~TRINITY_DN4170_c0_g1_i2.p1  ORF type:complete len:520 (-),score=133.02 TRINITY_DN4170_c0_g1_i2:21-1436(-)